MLFNTPQAALRATALTYLWAVLGHHASISLTNRLVASPAHETCTQGVGRRTFVRANTAGRSCNLSPGCRLLRNLGRDCGLEGAGASTDVSGQPFVNRRWVAQARQRRQAITGIWLWITTRASSVGCRPSFCCCGIAVSWRVPSCFWDVVGVMPTEWLTLPRHSSRRRACRRLAAPQRVHCG